MKRINLLAFGLLALPAVVSCSNDDAPSVHNDDVEVALGLSLDNLISGRASIGDGMLDNENYIIDGEYAIIMKLDAYRNQVHCCRFGISPLDNGRRGNIYLVDADSKDVAPAPLKWSEVDVKSFDFTIDNIGYKEACAFDAASGFLGREWTEYEKNVTYRAQKEVYDESGVPGHSNDIIWGSGTALYGPSKGKEVSYATLTHRMTRVNVAFVNLSEQQQKDMTVSLSNLVLVPESFNRADGTVAIADNPQREDLVLFNGKDNKDEKLSVIRDETAQGTYLEHVTANYILPPQALTDEHWPEIIVSYTDESGATKEVRGLIPHDILNEDDNSWEGLDGLNAGNHLTIVAEIKDGIPDIVFTAKVRKWVDLGTMIVTANQNSGTPGIRNIDELKHCISLYNALPQFKDPDSWEPAYAQKLTYFGDLMQYGDCEIVGSYLKWTFYINFPLDEKNLPQPGFRYMLCRLGEHGDYTQWTYPLTFVDRSGSNDQTIMNKLKGEQGIYNMEDLNHMIKAFNEHNVGFMAFYGPADTKNYIFEVDLRDSFSGELLKKLDYSKNVWFDKTPTLILNTNGFSVNGVENVGELIGIQ